MTNKYKILNIACSVVLIISFLICLFTFCYINDKNENKNNYINKQIDSIEIILDSLKKK